MPSFVQIMACHQATIWANVGLLSLGPLRRNEIIIKIKQFPYNKMTLKMLSAKWHTYASLGLNDLRVTLFMHSQVRIQLISFFHFHQGSVTHIYVCKLGPYCRLQNGGHLGSVWMLEPGCVAGRDEERYSITSDSDIYPMSCKNKYPSRYGIKTTTTFYLLDVDG